MGDEVSKKEASPNIRAKDLVTKQILRISTAHTLREAMGVILFAEEKGHETAAILVIDQEGEFAGVLTGRDIAMGLLDEADHRTEGQETFLRLVESRMQRKVDDVLPAKPPRIGLDATLASIVYAASQGDWECLPVFEEGGRVAGVIYLSDLFRSLAGVALDPEADQIQV